MSLNQVVKHTWTSFFSFFISNVSGRYQPGDHVAVLPNNPKDLVQRFADLFKIELDDTVNLQAISELRFFSQRQYKDWILEERRNIVDVVQTMSSVNIPVDILLESLPRLKPRFYSISSSFLRYTNCLHLTAVVVKEETPSGRLFKGLTTSWFTSLPSKDADPESQNRSLFIPIYLQTSSFHLPRSRNIPIIMIAAGTGLAPFRAFIQERAELNRIKGSTSAAMLLFFGCRRKSDYLYADELESAQRSGLLELYVTFSRDSLDGRKSYVQDRMLQMADKIWHLLDESHAHLYICGSAVAMARDVHACLLRIIHTAGELSAVEAKLYLDRLKTDGRYHMDVWG
ncbi:NADPH-ferrihemoprotein reductase [Paragonimus westermani]|uniref:NADPH--hemoprotein reductase n=1 Tax=Paragonimus westermani TaxID=34504 RepID=A0A5J4N9N2_9TREM|nr:NADPH-ferrihemoprotein reductase [Paragonimus westermani]